MMIVGPPAGIAPGSGALLEAGSASREVRRSGVGRSKKLIG